MKTLASLAAALLLCAGCGFMDRVEFGGVSVQESDGVLKVDGVPLPHARWIPVDLPHDLGGLVLESATREVRVSSVAAGEPGRLEAQVFSESEGDGAVVLAGGRLVASSTLGQRVLLNGVRGTLPCGAHLVVRTGIGACAVDATQGLAGVELESGTGAVELRGAPLGDVQLKLGTGHASVASAGAERVEVESGTADVTIAGLQARLLGIETGTGKVSLKEVAVTELRLESGTGDFRIEDCRAERTTVASGTGDVRLAGTNALGKASYDLGTGDVLPAGGP